MKLSRGALYFLFSTFLFSLLTLCVKFLQRIPSHEIIFFRSMISLSLCYLFLKKAGLSLWGKNKKLLFFRGFFGAIGLSLYFYTIQMMPLANAVALFYLIPLFSVAISALFLKESATPLQWLSLVFSFLGILLVKGFENSSVGLIPFLAGIGASLSAAIAYSLIRKIEHTEHSLHIIVALPLITLPLVTPLTFNEWVTPLGTDWIFLILIGLLTQIAQLFMTKAFQNEKAAEIMGFQYLGIVFSSLYGWFFFDELLSLQENIGIGIIILCALTSANAQQKQS